MSSSLSSSSSSLAVAMSLLLLACRLCLCTNGTKTVPPLDVVPSFAINTLTGEYVHIQSYPQSGLRRPLVLVGFQSLNPKHQYMWTSGLSLSALLVNLPMEVNVLVVPYTPSSSIAEGQATVLSDLVRAVSARLVWEGNITEQLATHRLSQLQFATTSIYDESGTPDWLLPTLLTKPSAFPTMALAVFDRSNKTFTFIQDTPRLDAEAFVFPAWSNKTYLLMAYNDPCSNVTRQLPTNFSTVALVSVTDMKHAALSTRCTYYWVIAMAQVSGFQGVVFYQELGQDLEWINCDGVGQDDHYSDEDAAAIDDFLCATFPFAIPSTMISYQAGFNMSVILEANLTATVQFPRYADPSYYAAIDHRGRYVETGLEAYPDFRFVVWQAEQLDRLRRQAEALAQEGPDVVELQLFNGSLSLVPNTKIERTLQLPLPPSLLQQYTKMELVMELGCANTSFLSCPDWDQAAQLFMCCHASPTNTSSPRTTSTSHPANADSPAPHLHHVQPPADRPASQAQAGWYTRSRHSRQGPSRANTRSRHTRDHSAFRTRRHLHSVSHHMAGVGAGAGTGNLPSDATMQHSFSGGGGAAPHLWACSQPRGWDAASAGRLADQLLAAAPEPWQGRPAITTTSTQPGGDSDAALGGPLADAEYGRAPSERQGAAREGDAGGVDGLDVAIDYEHAWAQLSRAPVAASRSSHPVRGRAPSAGGAEDLARLQHPGRAVAALAAAPPHRRGLRGRLTSDHDRAAHNFPADAPARDVHHLGGVKHMPVRKHKGRTKMVEVYQQPGPDGRGSLLLPQLGARAAQQHSQQQQQQPSAHYVPHNTSNCDLEIGRWITPYKCALNYWVTDITPLLPLLVNSTTCTFTQQIYYWVGGWNPRITLRLTKPPPAAAAQPGTVTQHSGAPPPPPPLGQFSRPQPPLSLNQSAALSPQQQSVLQPLQVVPLWRGSEVFNATYASHFPAVTLATPRGTAAVQLFVTFTGHGSDEQNCAEFCATEQVFVVNGHNVSFSFGAAGSAYGCSALVASGTTPNQYGTWMYGRNGWCPGRQVDPVVMDVTGRVNLKAGAANTITYTSLFNGSAHNSSGNTAYLTMYSYAVFYARRRSGDVRGVAAVKSA